MDSTMPSILFIPAFTRFFAISYNTGIAVGSIPALSLLGLSILLSRAERSLNSVSRACLVVDLLSRLVVVSAISFLIFLTVSAAFFFAAISSTAASRVVTSVSCRSSSVIFAASAGLVPVFLALSARVSPTSCMAFTGSSIILESAAFTACPYSLSLPGTFDSVARAWSVSTSPSLMARILTASYIVASRTPWGGNSSPIAMRLAAS